MTIDSALSLMISFGALVAFIVANQRKEK